MKKYATLFGLTLVLSLGIVQAGNTYKNSFVPVSIVKVNPITAESSIYCNNGTVERADSRNIYVAAGSTVEKVYVKKGDKVKAGQPLLSILPISKTVLQDAEKKMDDQTYQELLNAYFSQITGESVPASIPGLPSAAAPSASDQGGTNAPADAEQLESQEVAAPADGEVISVSVEEQGTAEGNKPVLTIAASPDLQVRLSVNESQISDIKIGQKAVVTGAGFKTAYEGTVTAISPDAKQQYTTAGTSETVVEVLVRIKNPKSDIKPGFSAKTKIITAESKDVLIAPYEAVRADDDGNEYVYLFNGRKAVKKPVITQKEFESGFEVLSGLEKQDAIILNPDAVTDGAAVILREAVDSDD